jgi:uncharacterized protein YlxW (UPF0749 family)
MKSVSIVGTSHRGFPEVCGFGTLTGVGFFLAFPGLTDDVLAAGTALVAPFAASFAVSFDSGVAALDVRGSSAFLGDFGSGTAAGSCRWDDVVFSTSLVAASTDVRHVKTVGTMARQTHGRRGPLRASLSAALVLFLSGLMFVANARLTSGEETRHPENFGQLVEQESARGDDLFAEVEGLRASIKDLTALADAQVPRVAPEMAVRSAIATGSAPHVGPGISVTLQDAPASRIQPEGITPDDLVVHQEDLEGVINALWAGGAEAMTLAGQRVTSLSAFRCVGNVLSLHGRVYSPPYEVRAIGDPDRLMDALDASKPVGLYRQYVEYVGLGWEVRTLDSMELPAYDGTLNLQFAEVPDGTEIYR